MSSQKSPGGISSVPQLHALLQGQSARAALHSRTFEIEREHAKSRTEIFGLHSFYICTLSSKLGCQTWTRTKTSGLTGRRATLTLSGNGTAGRIPTCIVPFR